MGDKKLQQGDYVLATKYADGDPKDHWCVGYLESIITRASGDRYLVVDSEGIPFRANGFRRVVKIKGTVGQCLIDHKTEIEQSCRSVWFWERFYEKKLRYWEEAG